MCNSIPECAFLKYYQSALRALTIPAVSDIMCFYDIEVAQDSKGHDMEQERKSPLKRNGKWGSLLLSCCLVGLNSCGAFDGPDSAIDGSDRVIDESKIRRVVVIHFDTTRLDDWSCYGGIPDTPNVDAVASTGLRYTNAITTVPYTSPSIATFLTGQSSDRHRVRTPTAPMNPDLTTLTEILKENGFYTGGFCGNPTLFMMDRAGHVAGYDRGFDVMQKKLNYAPKGLSKTLEYAPSFRLTRGALDFVKKHRKNKFFLWMLYIDPHLPYTSAPPYDTKYRNHPDIVAQSRPLTGKWAGVESGDYIARHKGGVAVVDDALGGLLAELESLEGKTLLIITSDHGESLGDSDYWFDHGNNLRHPCINVPLVIRCEGIVPTGVRDTLVGNIDLAPTILDLLKIDATALDADGRSLAPTFAEQDPWPERLIPIQTDFPWEFPVRRGVRSKYYSFQAEFKHQSNELISAALFDRREDPLEAQNLYDVKPDLGARFEEIVRTINFSPVGDAPELPTFDDPDLQEELRALGYLE